MRCKSYRSWGQALGRNLMGAAAANTGEHYAIPSEQCMADGIGTGSGEHQAVPMSAEGRRPFVKSYVINNAQDNLTRGDSTDESIDAG